MSKWYLKPQKKAWLMHTVLLYGMRWTYSMLLQKQKLKLAVLQFYKVDELGTWEWWEIHSRELISKITRNKDRKMGYSSDEDETLYYRYATPSSSNSTNSATTTKRNTLAPSKSTVYISNLDYSLTNSDLFTIFSTFGKVARVTVLKDRVTRLSRGVAFVLFVSRDDAVSASREMHGKVLNGRTLRASIAADNGRAPEFIRRRVYKDKSRCYECCEEGHLSYECPRNQLGPRERPEPKKGRRRDDDDNNGNGGDAKEWIEDDSVFESDNWASVVDNDADQRLLMREEEKQEIKKGKKVKKASYFSDESGEED